MLEIIRTGPNTWSIGFKGKNGVAKRDSRFSPHLDEFEAKWLFKFERQGEATTYANRRK